MKLLTLLLGIPAAMTLGIGEANVNCAQDIMDNCETASVDEIIEWTEYYCAAYFACSNKIKVKPWDLNLSVNKFCDN